ncbi:Uridine kinase [Rheinheimera pacifica]|uniref:Uridine kinase n=1 Tax=Rheinheimera pacifica TaxID=173990 RepID=A0A1H6JAL4_9GAMM|nr:AAA family ATPase [Rheinheimera pacifica]SEH56039.1 Uridine kinase [Rheinheimera pacifica]
MDRVKVVAISGASGCGKTSTVRQLSSDFGCPFLHFDDYVHQFSYPKDMKKWKENGADVSEIYTPDMINNLRQLIESSHSYVFVEEPFGRERSCISSFIDYVVLLDQPMDICLSRVIRRNIERHSNDSHSSVLKYLSNYEDHFRDIYIKTVNKVRKNCDLIIQEICPVSVTADIVSKWLKSKAN